MHLFEVKRKEAVGEEDFPLLGYTSTITLGVDFGDVEVPPRAARRIAFNVLREIADTLCEDDVHVKEEGEAPDVNDLPVVRRNGDTWRKPDGLDMRVIKSAHRVVMEVAKRGVGGRAVLASDLVGSIGLSAPTVGRLLKDGDPGYDYLKPYVTVTPHGRTKAVDLTPEGRILASKIRAGSVPG